MRNEEWAIIETLEQPAKKLAKELFDYALYLCEDLPYRVTVPAYTKPWFSGKRNKQQQRWFFDRGLSRCDGVKKKSKHQFGLAIHIGLRYRETNRFIRYDKAPVEAKQVFLLIIDKAKQLGFRWGGDWRSFRDWHHLELK